MSTPRTLRTFLCIECGNLIYESEFTAYRNRRVTGQAGHDQDCTYNRVRERVQKEQRSTLQRKETHTAMGMFDKDKLFAPDGQLRNWVDEGVEFVLWDIEYKGDIETPDGPSDTAEMVWLTVAPLDAPENRATVSMIGPLAKARADAKEDGDLPAIIETRTVPASKEGFNDAYVFNFVREFSGAETVKRGKAKDAATA